MVSQNLAAWQTAPKAPSLEVKDAPYTKPAAAEILIRNFAVAVNIVDAVTQSAGPDLFPWIKYPQILGNDIAGEVAEVGPGVESFKPGDRVVAHAINITNNKPSEGAFQLYTIVSDFMAAPIPNSLSYEQATGKTLLVWGGASSVGCCAVQLAVASGYEVFAVASPKNFALLEKLGAAKVFDYHQGDVIKQIVSAFVGKDSAGGMAIAPGSIGPVAEVLSQVTGVKLIANISVQAAELPEGVKANNVFGGTLRDNKVGRAVYSDFLGKALAAGTFICAPEPQVVGKGLESVQQAFEVCREGVSAKKVVVTLA
ncbi:hypothetical protein KVR01_000977 [Diaporthe batatas]|uniref:uncharacterized protein n=1 Tax=Diaporthe batatas TaxID=748121 RepID=UPI001D03B626|nr:uncharacterized protein KVR01_000977 [Diaporthe batatas]KAG8170232.1 hypothetical protein KVR01_000977 [Diaporthe batatas]